MQRLIRYLKEKPRMKRFSDLFFSAAIALSGYTLISTYFIRKSLPAGICPINTRLPLYYTTIAFLAIAFVLSFFDKRKNL